jgi:hypothetical protein
MADDWMFVAGLVLMVFILADVRRQSKKLDIIWDALIEAGLEDDR